MRTIDDIAERYMADLVANSPIRATGLGVRGSDDAYDDFTPEGFAARAQMDRSALSQAQAVEPENERQRVAIDVMSERLSSAVERYDAGDVTSGICVLGSPMHQVRSVFDLMSTDGAETLDNIVARLSKVPTALRQYESTLRHEASQGNIVPRRQLIECAKQTDNWNGASGNDFWAGLIARLTINGEPVGGPRAQQLERAAQQARSGLASFGEFLRDELAPHAPVKDAVGREKYERSSRHFLGTNVDLEETYQWGWDELHRIETEMAQVSNQIKPGATVDEAIAVLDADLQRTIIGTARFRDWMQQLSEDTIADMQSHFHIPEALQRIECMIAPTSDGTIYYTGPSEDFSRPGRMWWSVPPSQNDFSTWRQTTTVFHEGVPGHHLQIGQTAYRNDLLNRFQRRAAMCSGHAEGWALYAERLMDELGFLADPGNKLGMLDGQAFRATRVIIDIGMHLELKIPTDNPFGFAPGQRWTPELGWQFLTDHCRDNHDFLRFELNRYLGWPGQAPSYKVGERAWLQARENYKARKGSQFNLRQFHADALNLGPMGLDPFFAALDRL